MKSATNWKHVCTYCKRAFSRSEHKARHERSHTGTKPFECKVCLRGFVRRDLLQRHIRTVHKKLISSEKGTAQVDEIIKAPISEEKVNSIIKVNYSSVNVIKMNFQQTHASYEFDSTLPQKKTITKKKTIVIDMQRAIIMKNNKIQIPIDSFYKFYDIGLMYLNKLQPSHAYKTVSEDIVTLLIYLGSLISHDPHCNTIWSVVWKSLYEPDKSEAKVQDKFISLTLLLFLSNSAIVDSNIVVDSKWKQNYRLYYQKLSKIIQTNPTFTSVDSQLIFQVFTTSLRNFSVTSKSKYKETTIVIYDWFLKALITDEGNTLSYYLKNISSSDKLLLPYNITALLSNTLYCEYTLGYPNFRNRYEFHNGILFLLESWKDINKDQTTKDPIEYSIEQYFPTSINKSFGDSYWLLLETTWLEFLNSYETNSNQLPDGDFLLKKQYEKQSIFHSIDLLKLDDNFVIPTLTILSRLSSPDNEVLNEKHFPLIMDIIAFQIRLLATEITKLSNGCGFDNTLKNKTMKVLFSSWNYILHNMKGKNGGHNSEDMLQFSYFVSNCIVNNSIDPNISSFNFIRDYHYFLRSIMKCLKTNILMDKLITSENEIEQNTKSILIKIWEDLQNVIKKYWDVPSELAVAPESAIFMSRELSKSISSVPFLESERTNSKKIILPPPVMMRSIDSKNHYLMTPSTSQHSFILSYPLALSSSVGSNNTYNFGPSHSLTSLPMTPAAFSNQSMNGEVLVSAPMAHSFNNMIYSNYGSSNSNKSTINNNTNNISTTSNSTNDNNDTIKNKIKNNNYNNIQLPSTSELFGYSIK